MAKQLMIADGQMEGSAQAYKENIYASDYRISVTGNTIHLYKDSTEKSEAELPAYTMDRPTEEAVLKLLVGGVQIDEEQLPAYSLRFNSATKKLELLMDGKVISSVPTTGMGGETKDLYVSHNGIYDAPSEGVSGFSKVFVTVDNDNYTLDSDLEIKVPAKVAFSSYINTYGTIVFSTGALPKIGYKRSVSSKLNTYGTTVASTLNNIEMS